jgi:hypothetical protein
MAHFLPKLCQVPGALLILMLAACAPSLVDGPRPPHNEPEPPYRKIIIQDLRWQLSEGLFLAGQAPATSASEEKQTGMFSNPKMLGAVEISGVRRVFHATQGLVWLVCLKVDALSRRPLTYAIFIRVDEIVDWRSNVWVDRCDEQIYEPLGL